jgi:putative membrane protein insertion efficiency factor
MEKFLSMDSTIDESKQASINKAISLLLKPAEGINNISRPKVSIIKGIIFFLSYIAILYILLNSLFSWLQIPIWMSYFIIIFITIAVLLISIKKIIFWSIKVYQRYAPTRLRLSCLFIPSCSEYMIQAIEKYGVFIGLYRGIKRLFRCHYPNGGYDYP